MGFGKDNKGAIIRELTAITLGALGAQDAVIAGGPAITDSFRIIKSEVEMVITGLTDNEGGGIYLGLANGALSAAQIEVAMETVGPLSRSDRVNTEQAERYTKLLGGVDGIVEGPATVLRLINKQGGHIVEETIRWTFTNTAGWNWFLYNLGSAMTTGATAQVLAKHFGVWIL